MHEREKPLRPSHGLILQQPLVVEVDVRRVNVVELHVLEVGLQLRLNIVHVDLSTGTLNKGHVVKLSFK